MTDNTIYDNEVNNTYEVPQCMIRRDQPRVYHPTADVHDYATQGSNEFEEVYGCS